MSTLLIREVQTDLRPFTPPDLELAHNQWLLELHRRMASLEQTRAESANDLEYGGAAAHMHDMHKLEDAVDEARRMVCNLGGEMRRRSEGEVPVWMKQRHGGAQLARGLSAGAIGLVRATTTT